MRWRPEEPQIDDKEGFRKGTDLFGYQQFGRRLANIVAASEDDPVVLIDGDWGSGKTVFALQWAGLLRQRGHAVVYVDAFASDHQNDPFLALVEAVYGFAEQRGVKKPARTFSAAAAKVAALALLKEVGRQVTGLDVTAVVKEMAEGVDQRASRLREWIEEAKDRRAAVREFRAALKELAKASVEGGADPGGAGSEPSGDQDAHPGRLIIVVDELDRCRPDFALGLLERIKHVFGVPGVCFVLVTNFSQLQQSVKRAYGDVEARSYLEKFYCLRFRLPEGGRRGGRSKIEVYAERLWKQLASEGSAVALEGLAAFRSLAASERMSLRAMEHAMRNVLVLATTEDASYFGRVPNGVLISVIRVVRPELFERIERGEALEKDLEIGTLKRAAYRGDFRLGRPARGEEMTESLAEELRMNWRLQEAARCLSAFEF